MLIKALRLAAPCSSSSAMGEAQIIKNIFDAVQGLQSEAIRDGDKAMAALRELLAK